MRSGPQSVFRTPQPQNERVVVLLFHFKSREDAGHAQKRHTHVFVVFAFGGVPFWFQPQKGYDQTNQNLMQGEQCNVQCEVLSNAYCSLKSLRNSVNSKSTLRVSCQHWLCASRMQRLVHPEPSPGWDLRPQKEPFQKQLSSVLLGLPSKLQMLNCYFYLQPLAAFFSGCHPNCKC